MSTTKLAGIVILLASSCPIAADTDGPDSPDHSIAATETHPDKRRERPKSADASDRDHGPRSSLAHALVAVVSTPASEAEPCERMCGGLGDCLLADPDYSPANAGGLELQCLDLCVHSPDDHPAKAEFLACGAHDQCAGLQNCAEQHWSALAKTRRGPKVGGVLTSANPCKTGCRWLYACVYTNMPPGAGTLDSSAQQQLQTCISDCDERTYDNDTQAMMAMLAACLPTHCNAGTMHECWESH